MSDLNSLWIQMLSEEWSGPVRLRVQGQSMWPTLRPGDQVTVEPLAADDLRPGDWVVMRRTDALIVHRFLAFSRDGLLLTKGDSRPFPDPPWPRQALVGRVVACSRQGQDLPLSPASFRERMRTRWHRLLARAWLLLHRLKQGLLLAILVSLALTPDVRAAVDLLSFQATPAGQAILVTWQTASELDMLGFYLWRSTEAPANYQRISDLILATGDPFGGASYGYTDLAVVGGGTYYYRLEAVEIGGASSFYGPVSATVPAAPTNTPTLTPSPTPTPTPSPTPSRTPSPTPSRTSSPTPSRTPSSTPTRTPTPSPTSTLAPQASATLPPTTRPAATLTAVPSRAPTRTPAASPSLTAAASPSPSIPPPTVTTGSPQPEGTISPTFTPRPSPTAAPPTAAEEAVTASPVPATAPVPGQEAVAGKAPAAVERLRNWVVFGVLAAIALGLAGIALALGLYALARWRRSRHG